MSIARCRLNVTLASACEVSLAAVESSHRIPRRGPGGGHHVPAEALRSRVPGGLDELVQSGGSVLEVVYGSRCELLHGGVEGGNVESRYAANLQNRPKITVHVYGVPRYAATSWHHHKHGWPRMLAGQRGGGIFRALVEVRMSVPSCVRRSSGASGPLGVMDRVRQPLADTPDIGISNPCRDSQ